MKTVIAPDLRDSELLKCSGANAKLWMFHATHKRFAIMLSRPGGAEVVYIVAIGCEHIAGPFCWNDADISIMSRPSTTSKLGLECIVDKVAGFELVCSAVTLVTAPAGDYDTTFEGFLGEP